MCYTFRFSACVQYEKIEVSMFFPHIFKWPLGTKSHHSAINTKRQHFYSNSLKNMAAQLPTYPNTMPYGYCIKLYHDWWWQLIETTFDYRLTSKFITLWQTKKSTQNFTGLISCAHGFPKSGHDNLLHLESIHDRSSQICIPNSWGKPAGPVTAMVAVKYTSDQPQRINWKRSTCLQ